MESNENGSNKGKRPTKAEEGKISDCFGGLSKKLSDKGPTKGKRMKKDDSGISVMPESENSDSDSGTNDNSEIKISESSTSNLSADTVNVDPGCSSEPKQKNKVFETAKKETSITSDISDSDEDICDTKPSGSSSCDSNSKVKNYKSKPKKDVCISSDGEDNIEENNSKDKKKQKDKKKEQKNDKYDPTPNTPRPVHNWSAPLSVISRQYGTSSKYSPDLFRHNSYGSLHMVERLELMYKMKKHDGCVNSLNFNQTGTKLVTGSDDLNIVIWDWATSDPILVYNSEHTSNVFQAKFVPFSGDCHVVTSARDGQIRIAELSSTGTCKGTRKIGQHRGAVHKLAMQKDSPHVFLSCAEDGLVYLIDLRVERRKDNPQKLATCMENEKRVPLYSININPQKTNEYVVGGRSPYVKVYDTRFTTEETACLKTFAPAHLAVRGAAANVTAAVYNYNGEEILASYNEDIYLFSSHENDSSKYLHRYRGHRNSQTIKGVNFFGSKSEFVISGSDCGYVFFWEKESEHIVKFMYGDEMGVVNCIEPHPHMPVLATSGLDDDIKIWIPSCENEPDLSRLREHVINNMREQEDENLRDCSDGGAFVDNTILFLMQHLSRYRRRRQRPVLWSERDNEESETTSSDLDEDDGEPRPALQCSQS